jgi:class 3 adenylate cyclase/tetratricopeptide (TPR) repeat protein
MSQDLADWLLSQGLERYQPLFEQNEVDLATLRQLSDDDLKELGLPFGPRKRILNMLSDRRPAEPPHPMLGAQPIPAGERRQLTVLFCDMVGFTKLAYKLDPERLQLVIRAYENACASCVNRYDGYVFTTLGDGVVAFFGYPMAHENEAERAIRAGLDIVEAVGALHAPYAGRLQVRVGVATGIVVVAPGERNAVGETMNLASRLQTVAKPGSVIVSEQVRRLAAGAFRFEDLGERELKGVSAPTRLHRVLGLSNLESRYANATQGGVTPLVGRETELETALDAWKQTQAARSGRAILIAGEAGMGKSRIVAALRDQLAERVKQTLIYQASPFFANTAFQPIIGWFERALDLHHDDPPQTRLDKLEALVVNRFGFEKEDLRLVAAMLSLPFQERYGQILLSPKLAREDTIRVLIDMVRAQASADPTLFVFEDLHWADPTTRDVIDRLIDRLSDIPGLVVATTRPDFVPAWRESPDVVEMPLSRFETKESRWLVAQVPGGAALPRALADQIVARAEGVPLFVEELTKVVTESLSDAVGDVSIPATLRDSLMARLDRVPAAKEIAQVGSVIGRDFNYELLAGLNLMSEEALISGLSQLTASGLATSSGLMPKCVYSFSHALVQDAAYESLLKSRRRHLHGEVARLFAVMRPEMAATTPELLAYHHVAAEQYRLAAPLWLKAGENAFSRFALAEAVSHLRAGLAAAEKLRPSRQRDVVELSLRSLIGPTLVAQRGWGNPEVSEALEPAWRLAQSLASRKTYLPILSVLAVHTMSRGALGASLGWCQRMLEHGAEAGDDGLVIVGHRSAAATRFWLGDFRGARRDGDQVHRLYDAERHGRIAQATNSDPFTGEGVYRSQFLWMLGFPDQAEAANAAAVANARRRGHPFDLAFLLTLGAQVFGYRGEWQALLARADEAIRIGKERGISLFGEMLAEITRGIAWLQAGRSREAAEQLETAIARLMQTGHGIWIWYLKMLQAQAQAESGRLESARALMDESLARMEAGEERAHYAEALRLRGWLAGRQGDAEAAERYLRRALEVARAQGALSFELRAATCLAQRLAERGERAEAGALLRGVYDQFTEGFGTHDLQEARRALSEIGAAP